jgi:hypothetical protein
MLTTIIFLTCLVNPDLPPLTIVPGTWEIVAIHQPQPGLSQSNGPGLTGDVTTSDGSDDPTKTRYELQRIVEPGQTVNIPQFCRAKVTVEARK